MNLAETLIPETDLDSKKRDGVRISLGLSCHAKKPRREGQFYTCLLRLLDVSCWLKCESIHRFLGFAANEAA